MAGSPKGRKIDKSLGGKAKEIREQKSPEGVAPKKATMLSTMEVDSQKGRKDSTKLVPPKGVQGQHEAGSPEGCRT